MGRHGRNGRDGRDGRDILFGPKGFPFSLAPKGSSFLSFSRDAGVLSAPRLRVTREVTVDTGVCHPRPLGACFFARKSFHKWVSRKEIWYIPCPETLGQVVPSKKSRLKFWTNQNAYTGGHQSVDGRSQDCAFSVLPSAHGMGEAGRRVPFQGFHLPRAGPHCQSLGLHDGLADRIRQRDQTIPNGWRVYMSRHL